jgi:hypothetical protein
VRENDLDDLNVFLNNQRVRNWKSKYSTSKVTFDGNAWAMKLKDVDGVIRSSGGHNAGPDPANFHKTIEFGCGKSLDWLLLDAVEKVWQNSIPMGRSNPDHQSKTKK